MKKAPILTSALLALLAGAWLSLSTVGARSESAEKKPAQPAANAEKSPDARQPATEKETPELDITGPEVLRLARQRLRNYESVKANLIETAVIGGRSFRAEGTYLQGQNFQLKMSLDFELGKQRAYKASMLQVCDGQVLWTSRRHQNDLKKTAEPDASQSEVDGEQRITRRDIRQILREAAQHEQAYLSLLSAELGLGGISELLSSLEQSMAFGKVREEKNDGKPFLVFQGRWNLDVLENFLEEEELQELRTGDDARKLPRLPEHVPDMVRLYFDRESLFPRRVLYLKRPESAHTLTPMLSLNFVNIVLNAPVDADEFDFVPPDKVYPQDTTSKYIKRIRDAARKAKQ